MSLQMAAGAIAGLGVSTYDVCYMRLLRDTHHPSFCVPTPTGYLTLLKLRASPAQLFPKPHLQLKTCERVELRR